MILLVEKDNTFAEVYIAIFASVGLLVTRVVDSTEALLSMRQWQPDTIIIGDARLGVAGKMAFCRHLRRSVSAALIPIVLIGHKRPHAGPGAPFDAFVQRPSSVASLVSVVLGLTRSESLLSRALRMFKRVDALSSREARAVTTLHTRPDRNPFWLSSYSLVAVPKTGNWSGGCWSTRCVPLSDSLD